MNDPHDHHVVPQFVLRNFAVDNERSKVTTLAKESSFAVWMERSIKGIGYERDFYVHMVGGRPVSVETDINRTVETPISQSDTWAKVVAGRTDALDFSDRPILYSLVRHLETRTPHYFQTGEELAELAADPNSSIPFTDEEREMYAFMRANPEFRKVMFNATALRQFAPEYERSLIMVKRSPIPLRSSTTPVLAAPFEAIKGIDLPLPGVVPFQRVMAVAPDTMISVVVGDFGGAFVNFEIGLDEARIFNRNVAGQFAKFPMVRHMVCSRDDLVEDMTWAPYDLVKDTPLRAIFKRRAGT
jgi:hypothetical protein